MSDIGYQKLYELIEDSPLLKESIREAIQNERMVQFAAFMDNLAEALGNADGQTTEEIKAELIEEMGEKAYLEAEKKFLDFIEKLKANND